METLALYNTQGTSIGTVPAPSFLSADVDVQLVHRYFTWVRSVMRPTLGHTKTRGQVSGGGKKPWKQKGTGRARVGSSRSPLWRHGGVVFGPSPAQNWATRMPRAERRKALLNVLAAKAQSQDFIVLDQWSMDAPKTKAILSLVSNFERLKGRKVLHIHDSFDKILFASTSNLQEVSSTTIQNLNVIDLLNADALLVTASSFDALVTYFAK